MSEFKTRFDYLGLSTESKPTDKAVNGSTFYEVDTSKLYIFYKDNWYRKYKLNQIEQSNDITGDNLSINNTIKKKFIKAPIPRGNTTQASNPTPDNPVEIKTVTGDTNVIVENKNVLKLAYGKSIEYNGLTVSIDNEGVVTLNGTATNVSFPTFLISGDTLDKRSGTPNSTANPNFYNSVYQPSTSYILKYEVLGGTGGSATRPFFWLHTPSGSNEYLFAGNTSTTKTFTNAIGGFSFYVNGDTEYSNFKFRIQIEKGSTATTYTQHQEQLLSLTLGDIELCKIGDYQDYIYKDTGKWYKKNVIGKYVFNGEESFNFLERTGVNVFQNTTTLTSLIHKSNNEINIISNYLLGVTDNQGNVANSIRSNNSGQLYMTIPNTNPISASSSAFTTWLSSNNITTYYVLATPTDTEITNTTLITQLEAILKATSYNGQTNISGTSEGSAPLFDVKVYKEVI